MSMSKLSACLLAFAIAGASFAAAQEQKPPPVPFGDPLRPAPKAGPLPPLVFKKPLPTTSIATVDGAPVTQADLLLFLVKGNWQTVLQTLMLVNLLDIELKKAGITVTDQEIEEEQAKILARVAPGKTPEEVRALGAFNENEIRRQAWLSRGWDKVLIAEAKLKPENAPYVGPDEWLKTAPRTEGSWWPEWTRWLAARSGEPCEPPRIGRGPVDGESLPDAPGDYVHQ